MSVVNDRDKSEGGRPVDITDRAFDFAVRIVKFCRFLEKEADVSRTVCAQLH